MSEPFKATIATRLHGLSVVFRMWWLGYLVTVATGWIVLGWLAAYVVMIALVWAEMPDNSEVMQ